MWSRFYFILHAYVLIKLKSVDARSIGPEVLCHWCIARVVGTQNRRMKQSCIALHAHLVAYSCRCNYPTSSKVCKRNFHHIIQCHYSVDVDRSLQSLTTRNLRCILWFHLRTTQHEHSWGNCQSNKSDILHTTQLTTTRDRVFL